MSRQQVVYPLPVQVGDDEWRDRIDRLLRRRASYAELSVTAHVRRALTENA